MLAVGLDGWRHGWVAVVLDGGEFRSAALFPNAGDFVAAFPDATVFAIDIPIGLPATGKRQADLSARARLGRRSSTIFTMPPRNVIEAEPYARANALAKAEHGFGISRQAYALRPKILEVDAIAPDDDRLYEVHPELAFMAIGGEVAPPKRSYAGMVARQRLLAGAGIVLPEDLGDAGRAPVEDVLDAAGAAWVGWRIARGEAVPIPDPPETDAFGLRMAIWT